MAASKQYFDKVNAAGGVHGRTIRLVVEDMSYQMPKAQQNLNKLVKNVTLYNTALSNEIKEIELKIPKRFETLNKENYEERYKLGCATIHKENFLQGEKFIIHKVKSVKLDDILINNSIGFIKIDVEGHEKNVLEGAKNLIKKNMPNLLVEIEERHSQLKVEDTINFINKLGYKSYFFDGTDIKSTQILKSHNSKRNYIFIP